MVGAVDPDVPRLELIDLTKTYRTRPRRGPLTGGVGDMDGDDSGVSNVDEGEDDAREEDSVDLQVGHERIALAGVTARFQSGETVGIVGRTGAGKSKLLDVVSGATRPTRGVVRGTGTVLPLGAIRAPLSPQMTGRENLRLICHILGVPEDRIVWALNDAIAFSECGDAMERPVSEYSKEMYARLALATAFRLRPDILLIDGSYVAGDIHFREKCRLELEAIAQARRSLIMIVSPQIGWLRKVCTRCLWLEDGRLREDGPVERVIDHFQESEYIRNDDSILTDETLVARSGSALDATTDRRSEPFAVGDGPYDLSPVLPWSDRVSRFDAAWQARIAAFRRARPGNRLSVYMNILRIGGGDFVRADRFCLVDADQTKVGRVLPDEIVTLEFEFRTRVAPLEIRMRVELRDDYHLVMVSEPALPIRLSSIGVYVLSSPVDFGFDSHTFQTKAYKIIARAFFYADGVEGPQNINMTTRVMVLGEVKAAFARRWQQRHGEPSCVTEPTAAYIESILADEDLDKTRPGFKGRTRRQFLELPPILRPRWAWRAQQAMPNADAGAEGEGTRANGSDAGDVPKEESLPEAGFNRRDSGADLESAVGAGDVASVPNDPATDRVSESAAKDVDAAATLKTREKGWERTPTSEGVFASMAGCWRYRHLFPMFFRRSLQMVYLQTAFGIGWLFVQPAIAAIASVIVVGQVIGASTDPVPLLLHVLSGLSLWFLFRRGLMWMTKSIQRNRRILRIAHFPRIIIHITSGSPALLEYLVILLMTMFACIYYALSESYVPPIGWHTAGVLAALTLTILLVFGLSCFLTVLNVLAGDTWFVLRYTLSLWMVLTPVVYPLHIVPDELLPIVMLNPMTPIVELYRWSLFQPGPLDQVYLAISIGLITALNIAGLIFYFRWESEGLDQF